MEVVTRLGEMQWFLVPTARRGDRVVRGRQRREAAIAARDLALIGPSQSVRLRGDRLAGIGVNIIKVVIGRARAARVLRRGLLRRRSADLRLRSRRFRPATATACALAFAVTMLVPQARLPLFAFAALIALRHRHHRALGRRHGRRCRARAGDSALRAPLVRLARPRLHHRGGRPHGVDAAGTSGRRRLAARPKTASSARSPGARGVTA